MIIQNAIRILSTFPEETYLVSSHVHDYQSHTFEDGTTIIVDGGNDYLKRGGSCLNKSNESYAEKWLEFSLDDRAPFEIIKKNLLWGTYGKDGINPLKYVRLETCEDIHLRAILDTQHLPKLYKKVIVSIFGDRLKKSSIK